MTTTNAQTHADDLARILAENDFRTEDILGSDQTVIMNVLTPTGEYLHTITVTVTP